jgi:hypothetical protein
LQGLGILVSETAHASGTNGIGTFTLNKPIVIKVMVYKDVISKGRG